MTVITLNTIARRFMFIATALILAVAWLQAARADSGKNTVIIDVRTPAEYAAGHIKGAINIPVDRIGEDISTVPGIQKDSGILVYCRSGGRSARAQAILEQHGFKQVVNGGGLSDMAGRYPSCSSPHC